MSKADWLSTAVTLITTGAAYYIGGGKVAAVCLPAGIIIIIWLHYYRREEGPATKPDWVAHWRNLSAKFKHIPSKRVRATWISESMDFHGGAVGEQWYMTDDAKMNGDKDCESLSKLAGVMLLKSPRVSQSLSEKVRTRSDDTWRWLYFLKDHKRALHNLSNGDAWASGRKLKTQGGDIEDLASVSARACLECSAEEIKQQ